MCGAGYVDRLESSLLSCAGGSSLHLISIYGVATERTFQLLSFEVGRREGIIVKPDRINTWPSRERPRERLMAEGPDHLTDAELLAIILRVGRGTFKTGVRGDTAVTLARSLLADFQCAL